MFGKEKCKYLREIRKKIALENDIALVTSECTFKGECKGTCPKCEAEVRYLEQALDKRRNLGKVITLAGLTLAGVASSGLLASCDEYADGDMPYYPFGEDNLHERAERSTLYQNILDRLNQNNIVAAESDTLMHWHDFGFTVTKTGEITSLRFYDQPDESPYQTEITALLMSIPQDELNTLQEDWHFRVMYYAENGRIVFKYAYYY
ncbi:MAG: hypothetical protein IKX43_02710 [Paludibacteraceae bacterium]|nr:hypothetical protein [Paludibacteraceae bacterium]